MLLWDKLLQPLRSRKASSVFKGTNDTRSAFKKDYDTVCNSTTLRRLQDKAQVFPLEMEDYARTRLTHSIEVMSVAESLGMQARDRIRIDIDEYTSSLYDRAQLETYINDIPIILKTAALLHDMGNPPFGHLGEQIISDWFKENLGRYTFNSEGVLVLGTTADSQDTLRSKLGERYYKDLSSFEGNAQLFRLVTKLSFVVDEHGMNLTFPVLATLAKYLSKSIEIDSDTLSKKKMGYFSSEEVLFKQVQNFLGTNGCRHPLAFLLEAADDISYLTADIEDAQRKRLITLSDIVEYFNKESNDLSVSIVMDEITRYKDDAKKMGYSDVDDYVSHRLRVMIKGMMINSVVEAFKQSYKMIMKGDLENELLDCSTVSTLSRVLRRIEAENIYYCPEVVKSKTRAVTIINKLLDTYIPATINYKSVDCGSERASNLIYTSFSTNYKFLCEEANKTAPDLKDELYNKILLVTDQISGMTDTYALSRYKMITAG